MTVLEQIVERTRERLLAEEKPDRRRAEEMVEGRTPFAFRAALRSSSIPDEAVGAPASPPAGPAEPALSEANGSRRRFGGAPAADALARRGRRARAARTPPIQPAGRRRSVGEIEDAAARLKHPRVIAEIKSASPSAGSIVENPDVEDIASAYARGGAAALSVVTEPEFFRGSRAWIARAKCGAGLPVVMKDFVVDPSQIVRGIGAGADAILLLASLLDLSRIRDFVALIEAYGCDALVEVHDEQELERALEGGARIVGVNNRDLRDFHVDLATSERLGALIPDGVIRVAESGIRGRADVERLGAAGFDAVLVGESLLRQRDRAAAVRSLGP